MRSGADADADAAGDGGLGVGSSSVTRVTRVTRAPNKARVQKRFFVVIRERKRESYILSTKHICYILPY